MIVIMKKIMHIDSYTFGKIVVNGKTFSKDIILTSEKVIPNWWRDEGHHMKLNDIHDIFTNYQPEYLIIGTGKFGMMKVSDEITEFCAKNTIKCIAKKTAKAIVEFNTYAEKNKSLVGAFHLTC